MSAIHGVTWLLIRDGAVLLERCEKKARVLGVGEWFVPGGKIEGDETPEQALRREISEEWPGAELLAWSPLPILEGSPVPPGPTGLFLMRPYVVNVSFAKAADGCVPAETSEGTPLQWFPVASALTSPVPQVRMMLAAAFSASPPAWSSSSSTPLSETPSDTAINANRLCAKCGEPFSAERPEIIVGDEACGYWKPRFSAHRECIEFRGNSASLAPLSEPTSEEER